MKQLEHIMPFFLAWASLLSMTAISSVSWLLLLHYGCWHLIRLTLAIISLSRLSLMFMYACGVVLGLCYLYYIIYLHSEYIH